MGIGINSGPAVLGDIGVNHSMSFAVIGHTVNVASRLQSLTRDLQTAILVADSTVQAVGRSRTADAANILQTLSNSSELAIRGSAQSARVWYNQLRYPLTARTSDFGPSVGAEALV
jgi:adenylate cyclase